MPLPRHRDLLAAASLVLLPTLSSASAADCAALEDDAQRLACYDRLFRQAAARNEALAAPAATAPVPVPTQAAAPAVERDAVTPGRSGQGLALTEAMSQFWELTPADKRGTFVVRTYLPNFFLPLHRTSGLNRAPSSPTRGAVPARDSDRSTEAKLRISLRAKVAEGLLLPDADLWLAYTQRSLWQLWNREDSSPFRSTDHEPEAIYVVPVPQGLGELPGSWRWRMVQLGLAHQSNGQNGALSRSWNRVYFGTAAERGDFGLQLRLNRRLRESGDDDNPDLTRYIGNAELTASWFPGSSTMQLAWRTHLRDLSRGSLQLDWTHPVWRDHPEGLRWYVQLFTGYGETLLDYNHRQTSLGVGLSLFSF
ncbi:phospholipase A [Azohydromonas caseinilytica]|uniref:Phospholipase A1 n=1 Tax=Azohydromonas caseinilytica TaxID=2728836 RepID=A0A848FA86_9BURK|nr:phospholipase A [Azohydromonas caseinilytica]NML16454.1 phospholipase A [Azohydromonas caseinilytica]